LTPFVLILLAFTLRVHDLAGKGLTYDEAASVAFATPDVATIVTYPQKAIYESPPLFYLALHGWQALAGRSEFAVRYFSVAWGVLLVPLIYALGRRLFHQAIGLLATIVAALSVIQVYYAQEARMYTLAPFLTVLSVWLMFSVLCPGSGWSELTARWDGENKHKTKNSMRWLAYIVVTVLAVFSHYYAGLVLIAENLYALVRRPSLRTWLVAQAIIGIVLAGWLALASGALTSLADVASGTSGEVLNLARLRGLWLDFSVGNLKSAIRGSPWVYGYLALLVLGLMVALGRTSKVLRDARSLTGAGLFVALWLFAPLALALAFPYRLAPRYLMPIAPAYYLLLGLGLGVLRRWPPLLGLGLAFVAGTSWVGLDAYYHLTKFDHRTMISKLEARLEPGDVIVLNGPRQHLLFRYYYRGDAPFYPVPLVDLPPYEEVNAPRLDRPRAEADLSRIVAGARRAWLVLSGEDETDPQFLVERWLNAQSYFVEEIRYARSRVRLYEFLPDPLLIPVVGDFAGELTLAGWGVMEPSVAPGGLLHVALAWRRLRVSDSERRVTVRLVDRADQVWAQRDGPPAGGYQPIANWPDGPITDRWVLFVDPAVPPGEYHLEVGVYDPASLRDLLWRDVSGAMAPRAKLGAIQVRNDEGSSSASFPGLDSRRFPGVGRYLQRRHADL